MKKEIKKRIKELEKGDRFGLIRRGGCWVFDMWSPMRGDGGGAVLYRRFRELLDSSSAETEK